MSQSLKRQAFVGVGWSAIERFSVQGVGFIVQIVLARLLTPADYGIVGMIAIFLQVSQVFIDSGFGNALIQKKECTEKDFSTVFFFNLLISVILYIALFLFSPAIAAFYNESILIPVTRFLALTLIFNALGIVQKTILVKTIDFKRQSYVSLTSAVVSGIIGIYLAYKGYGVWALCWQQLINSALSSLLYWLIVRWFPKYFIDAGSFRSLFGFGSKLLVSSIISVVYRNLYTIVIGKRFSTESLGYYSRAEQFAIFPSNNLGAIINRVAFPLLSKVQDNIPLLRDGYRRIIKYSSFLIFPLMIGLLSLANPLINVLLTDKWANVVPLLQILCLDWMLDHISLLNLSVLYVKGRSDYALRLEIIKKTIAIIILFSTVPFGIVIMCWGRVLYSVIATVLNTYYTKRIIDLGFLQQMADIVPYLCASFVMGLIVYGITLLCPTPLIQLVVGTVIGALIYSLISMFFFRKTISGILQMVKK